MIFSEEAILPGLPKKDTKVLLWGQALDDRGKDVESDSIKDVEGDDDDDLAACVGAVARAEWVTLERKVVGKGKTGRR